MINAAKRKGYTKTLKYTLFLSYTHKNLMLLVIKKQMICPW